MAVRYLSSLVCGASLLLLAFSYDRFACREQDEAL